MISLPIRYAYVASPYTCKVPSVEDMRAEIAAAASAILWEAQGVVPFNVIGHGRSFEAFLSAKPTHANWMFLDLAFLGALAAGCARGSLQVVIVAAPGWAASAGVQQEIDAARALGIEAVVDHELYAQALARVQQKAAA